MRYRDPLLVVLVVVPLLWGVFLVPTGEGSAGPPPDSDRLVQTGETDHAVWPYTSRSRSVEGRTLALNVVVEGSPDGVRRALERRSDANWTSVDGEGAISVVTADDSPWRDARGAARYSYVTRDRNASGHWVRADYQFAVGTYLGQRTHIRAYPVSDDWTALQAHTEYWDWFRLRHTVTGVASGARFVEQDLRDEPFVGTVSREYHGLDGGGSDGWVTVIRFASVALVASVALPSNRREWTLTDLAVPTILCGLVLGVRAAGLAAEGLFPATNPKLFAGLLYPVLAAGPPLTVAVLGRDRPAGRIAVLAATGLGAAIVLDLGVVGVSTVPLRLALHRVALVGAIALVALGVAREKRRTTVLGVSAWLVILALPLAGIV